MSVYATAAVKQSIMFSGELSHDEESVSATGIFTHFLRVFKKIYCPSQWTMSHK